MFKRKEYCFKSLVNLFGTRKGKNLRINLYQFPKASVAMLILKMVNLRENDQKPNGCDF